MAGKDSPQTSGSGQVIAVYLRRETALELLYALSVATGVPCSKGKGGKNGGKNGGKDGGKDGGKSSGKAAGGKDSGKAGGKSG